jgi:serine/threonine protein kinase
MGTVYKATHLVLQAPVAVKVIDREVAEGDVAIARFMREAQAAASLRSPHVVQILDYGTDGPYPYMVMELLEGENLADRLDRVSRLTPLETYKVITHVARAIGRAHEAGIIHRDLKPDNIFLVHNEGDEIAKVLDFGVAKIDGHALEGTRTRTGSLLGTPYYMSPEQAQGNKEIDHRSDLWALGVIAFECLTGQRPFSSDGLGDLVIQICIRDIVVPSQVAPVPPGFDVWFSRAVCREPEGRFQSARELAESLAEALGITKDALGPSEASGEIGAESLRRQRAATLDGSLSGAERQGDLRTTERDADSSPRSSPAAAAAPERSVSDAQADRPPKVLPPVTRPRFPSMPRHAVAESLPPPPPVGKAVLVVGLVFILLGGGSVFALRELGISLPVNPAILEWLRLPRRSKASTAAPPAKNAPPSAAPSDAAASPARAEPGTKKRSARPDDGHSHSGARTPSGAVDPGAALQPGSPPGDTPAPAREGNALDLLDEEAAKQTAPPVVEGPDPVVPDRLQPTPAPPEAPPAPAPAPVEEGAPVPPAAPPE